MLFLETFLIILIGTEGLKFAACICSMHLWRVRIIRFKNMNYRCQFSTPVKNACFMFFFIYLQIKRMLVVDPSKRYTARQCLDHPFFRIKEVTPKTEVRKQLRYSSYYNLVLTAISICSSILNSLHHLESSLSIVVIKM